MKKILIIGCGFIGLHLAKKLIEKGDEITFLSRDKDKISSWDLVNKIKFVEGSTLDQDLLDLNVKGKDVVINLTSLVDRRKTENIAVESLKINCLGELNILESLRKFNSSAIHIFLGSRAQFGKSDKNGKMLDEDEPQNPISFYGIHKKMCEEYLKYYQKLYGLKICSMRVSAVYG